MPVSHELVEAVCRQLYDRWQIVDSWEETSEDVTQANIEAALILSSRDVVLALVDAIGQDHVYEPDDNAMSVVRAALVQLVDPRSRREQAIARAAATLDRASDPALSSETVMAWIQLADAWLRLADYIRDRGDG